MHNRQIVLLSALLGACVVCGCIAAQPSRQRASVDPQRLTQFERDLREYRLRWRSVISSTAEAASNAARTQQTRDAVERWRSRILAEMTEITAASDSHEVLPNLWSLAYRCLDAVRTGANSESFGGQQSRIIGAVQELLDGARDLGRRYLGDEFEKVEQDIAANAAAEPFPDLLGDQDIPDFTDSAVGQAWGRTIGAVFGVFERADPMRSVKQAAAEVSAVVEDLPRSTRCEAQILVDDLEQREIVQRALRSVERAAESSERLSKAAEDLPENVRAVLQDAQEAQPALRDTLTQANETSTTLRETVAETQKLTESVAAVVEALRGLVKDVSELKGDAPPADAEREPFDIVEYQRAVESVTSATVEARGLVADARGLAVDPALDDALAKVDQHVDRTLTQTNIEARALVDHVAWRAAQFAGLIFVLAILYRALGARLAARGSKS